MKHKIMGKSNLGRHTAHRLSMFRTMITQLFEHEGITTTVTKMKRLKPIADKMVTLTKKGTMHHRRQVAAYLRNDDVVRKIFNEYPKRYANRQGGYTTAVRIGERKGDGAPMCFFMMVDSPLTHDIWKEVKDNARPQHQAPLKQ